MLFEQNIIPDPKNSFAHPRFKEIKNIVFDLGAVFYNIDYEEPRRRFLEMMVGDNLPIESTTTDLINTELFIRLETGKITPNGFRQGLRSQYQIEGTDNEIDQAWNSLLKGLMPGSLEIAQSLARHYRIFILSNSNQIHFEALKDECRQFFQSFEALFLSYEIGFRKPEALIFEYMEKQVDIAPDHTMFIDDNLENVQSAAKRGYLAVVNPFNEIPGYLL